MPAGPRDNQYSSLPPPGFTDDTLTLKRVQLIQLLEKVLDKCQHEPQFVEQQPNETDLLVAIAQFTLLPTPISLKDKRNFLNYIVTIGQDLLTNEVQVNNDEITLSIDSNSTRNDDKDATLVNLPSNTPTNEPDGDFSLDDLAKEYLQNEPSPSSLNDKPTPPSESDLTLDDLSKTSPSSSPGMDILSKLIFAPLSDNFIATKPQLESILFSNRLSSHDAAADADGIWKEESSPFGQIFCNKTNDNPIIVTTRSSTCLFDHFLYERLTRLISLLPKQCIRNSAQQLSVRPNTQQYRTQRPNPDNRRPSYRQSFQQNSAQIYHNQRFPPVQNVRQYVNSNYSNQQGNVASGGHFIDRRPQQQDRYPPPPSSFVPYPADHHYQQQQPRGPPKNHPHGGGGGGGGQQQQKKMNQNNNQRGPKKGSGGKSSFFYFSF